MVTRSTSFDKKLKFEISLQNFSSNRSMLDFLSVCLTIADLSVSGKRPLEKEIFIILVMMGESTSEHCFKTSVGTGSNWQHFFGALLMKPVTSSMKQFSVKTRTIALLQKSSQPTIFLKAFTEKTEGVRAVDINSILPNCLTRQAAHTDSWSSSPLNVNQSISRLIQSSPEQELHSGSGTDLDGQEILQRISSFHRSLLQYFSPGWDFSNLPEECYHHADLEKSNLDAHTAGNYRLISNLSYLSKLLERCVNKQLNDYLSANNLIPSVQSEYQKFHSTESAVLKVLSDIYAAAHEKMILLLGLLDLSAAFDTVDHQILFDRLLYE